MPHFCSSAVLIFPHLDFYSYVLSSLPKFESSSLIFALQMFFLRDNDYNMCSCFKKKKKLNKIGKIASYHLEIQILQNSRLDPLSAIHFCPHHQDTSNIALLTALTNTLLENTLFRVLWGHFLTHPWPWPLSGLHSPVITNLARFSMWKESSILDR